MSCAGLRAAIATTVASNVEATLGVVEKLAFDPRAAL
jgi:hypothetical protein